MATKTTKKPTPSKTAKSGSKSVLFSRAKFNWKIAAIIAVVLVIALGYLFIRMSNAAGTTLPGQLFSYPATQKQSKANGQVRLNGAGTANIILQSGSNAYPAYPTNYTEKSRYEVVFYSTTGATGTGGIYAFCDGKSLGAALDQSIQNGKKVSLGISRENIFLSCQGMKNITLSVVIPAGMYMVQMDVVHPSATQVPSQSAPPPTTGAKEQPAPSPGICGGLNSFGVGNQGPCVTTIQTRLRDLGYMQASQVDGIYGETTKAAVTKFQERNGLAQDGVVGPATWAKLQDPNAARKQ